MMGCIGIYFWLVLFIMQAGGSPYLIYYMQGIPGMDSQEDKDKIDTFKWSFLIVAIVSFLTANYLSVEPILHGGLWLVRHGHRAPRG